MDRERGHLPIGCESDSKAAFGVDQERQEQIRTLRTFLRTNQELFRKV